MKVIKRQDHKCVGHEINIFKGYTMPTTVSAEHMTVKLPNEARNTVTKCSRFKGVSPYTIIVIEMLDFCENTMSN